MASPVWNEIETTLTQLLLLPHNAVWLREQGKSPKEVVAQKLTNLRSGLVGDPKREEFVGPKLFLRVAGPGNAAYSGEWWFDAEVLDKLDRAYSRLYFDKHEHDQAIRNMLREVLAISDDFRNTLAEVWALELPGAARLVGYSGAGAPQRLFGNLPLSAQGNRMLVGRVRQVYFPFKNPFWVLQYRNLL